jgi:hypothetical protein
VVPALPPVTVPPLPAPLPPPPTVSVPTIPAPSVPAPSLPAPPAAPAAPSAPAAPAAPARTDAAAPPESSGRPAGGASPAAPSGSAQQPVSTYRSAPVSRTRVVSRPFRPVIARFSVRHALRIRIFVRQVAPVCRRIGVYSYAADRGTNAVRLPKRIGHHRLGAGTYVLTGKRGERRVFRARARVVRGRALVVRRGGPVVGCESPTLLLASTGAPTAAEAGTATTRKPTSAGQGRGVKSARESAPYVPSRHAPRHSPLVRTIGLEGAPDALRPLLLALLALSIGLLAAAALPQSALPAGPVAAFVAHRRGYIVAAGIWLLAVVAVVTTFA